VDFLNYETIQPFLAFGQNQSPIKKEIQHLLTPYPFYFHPHENRVKMMGLDMDGAQPKWLPRSPENDHFAS
jgi:hypothetical protein